MNKKMVLLVATLVTFQISHAAEIVVHYISADDAVFEKPDPTSGPWNESGATSIQLLPQNITQPSKFVVGAPSVDIKAAHNGKWIGLVVSWADATKDEQTASDQFPDAVAISFPQKDPMATSPFMGGPGAGVEVDHWKAIWQRDVERGYQDVTDLHPNTTVDGYRGSTTEKTHPVKEVLASPEGQESLPAVAKGNPMSQIDRTIPVEQLIAEGFGTLTTQPQQDARGWGVYENGRWTVVFTRPLSTGDSADTVLKPGETNSVNFAVWDGNSGDVGARKSYAMFTPLIIKEIP